MPNPLSQELFLENFSDFEKNYLKFKNSIMLPRTSHPFRKTWLPFYCELSTQITKKINASTGKNKYKYFDFGILGKAETYEGEPYIERIETTKIDPVLLAVAPWMAEQTVERISTTYRGSLLKLHQDGYAYGRLEVHNKIGFNLSEYIWIRWKSNLSNYEYIEPDDELELTDKDITFEICTEIPEKLALRFHGQSSKEIDCNAWIDFVNDPEHYPKKRSAVKKEPFTWEMAENCEYPDTTFTVFFEKEVTDELREKVLTEFDWFIQDYNLGKKWAIHDFDFAEGVPIGIDSVAIWVDFGNVNPKVIEKLMKWLQKSELEIARILIT